MIVENSPTISVTKIGDPMQISLQSSDGRPYEIRDVSTITLFDQGGGIEETRHECGLNDCSLWTTGRGTLIVEQPGEWSGPRLIYRAGELQLSFDGDGVDAGSRPIDIDRRCRTCGFYPEHCGDLETMTCFPEDGCFWCMRCVSRPC